jgi:hypothetical protein
MEDLDALEEFVKRLFVFFHIISKFKLNELLKDLRSLKNKQDLVMSDFSITPDKYMGEDMAVGFFGIATEKITNTIKNTSQITFGDSKLQRVYKSYNMYSIVELLVDYKIPPPRILSVVLACYRVWDLKIKDKDNTTITGKGIEDIRAIYDKLKIDDLIVPIFQSYDLIQPDSFTNLYISNLDAKHKILINKVKDMASILSSLKKIVED